MKSDRRCVVRRGTLLAGCLAALVFLAPGAAQAGVAGSKHDFTVVGIPVAGRTGLTAKGVCSACHMPHGAEPEAIWTRSVLLSRSLAEERLYFNQTVNPSYVGGSTLLCYDCHDNHSATVDNNPQDAWFNPARRPQDVAFDADMKLPLPTNNPRTSLATDNLPGFYENIPSRTAGPPVNASSYVSGHYVKTPPLGGTLLLGDKLPCNDCHDPHSNVNQAFIRPDLAGKTLTGKVASTEMSYDYVELPAGRNDALSREICIACHGTAEQTTFKAVTFSAINPAYGPATIVKPPPGVADHANAATAACTSCHSHNKPTVTCTDCHGTSPTEASPPAGAILGQFWPDGLAATGQTLYADNEIGAHPRHIEAIAKYLYGQTAAQAVAAGRQITICAFCHLNPGGGGHDLNDAALPSAASRVDVLSGLVGAEFQTYLVGATASGDDTHNVAAYSFSTRTCSNIDCHYEYVTPAYAGLGWDAADTAGNEPNCRTCHYYRDAVSGSGPGATAAWTPATPPLPNAHQVHVAGIVPGIPPANMDQSQAYPCSYCHPVPGATNHANGDIDLSTAGNPTLSKEVTPAADEVMTPSSYAVKYGAGPLLANTTCSNMYCHGADFGAVAGTELATQGTNVTPIWNSHLSGACGTCHDVDTKVTPTLGQTFTEGKHQQHIDNGGASYGPQLLHPDCVVCHGVPNATPALAAGNCSICHPGGTLVDVPGKASDEGWAAFPSRNHVQGNFEVNFENLDRGFNSMSDYDQTPGTVAVLGIPPNFIGGTDICNRCHSTAVVDGAVGVTLARTYWNTPGYRLPCLSCHNAAVPSWSSPVILPGVQAPAKDTYFTSRGHGNTTTYPWTPGRAGAGLVCATCHTTTLAHINGTLGEDRLLTAGNNLCGGCHGTAGTATKVSTHGNRSTTIPYTAQRPAFELNCVECHEVHGSANIFMVNPANSNGPLVAPRFYNGVADLATFLYRSATVVFGPTNTAGIDYAATIANANKICQTCHTVTGGTTVGTQVYQWNNATVNHYTEKCTKCHDHDFDGNYDPLTSADGFMPAGCNVCHGGQNNTAPRGNYWPDNLSATTVRPEDRDSSTLRHERHMEDLAARVWGETTAQLLTSNTGTALGGTRSTDEKQTKLCAYCHPDPYNSSYDPNNAAGDQSFSGLHRNGTKEVGGVYGHRLWDTYATPFLTTDGWTYTGTVTTWDGSCANVDCHNNKTTDTTAAGATSGYGWYDASGPSCIICHTPGGATNNPVSGLHRNSPTVSGVAHDDSFGVAGTCTTCHTALPPYLAGAASTHLNGAFTGDGTVPAQRTNMGLGSFTAYTVVSNANNGTGTCSGIGAPPAGVNTNCHDQGDGGTWRREWDSVNAYATIASLSPCKGCHGITTVDFTFGTVHNATDGQTEHSYSWDGDVNREVLTAAGHKGCKACHGVATATLPTDAHANYTVGANFWRGQDGQSLHGDGNLQMNGPVGTGAGYDQNIWGCSSVPACHDSGWAGGTYPTGTGHRMDDSNWTIDARDFGGAACDGCHGYPPTGLETPPYLNHLSRLRGVAGGTSTTTGFLASHDECAYCHGVSGNVAYPSIPSNFGTPVNLTAAGGDVYVIATMHNTGSVEINGVSGTDNSQNAAYNVSTGGCAKACHANTWKINATYPTTHLKVLREFGSGDCSTCHGSSPSVGCDGAPGTADDAPNVMGDGTSATGTGTPPKPYDNGTYGYNVNGHGANGSRIPALTPNLDCTACHDIGNPTPSKHNDCSGLENVNQRVNTRFYFGKLADTRNANTSHLVTGYLAGADNPPAKQIGFDDYCYNTCHPAAGRANMRHSYNATGNYDPASEITEFNSAWDVTDNPKTNLWAASPGGNAVWTPWTISDLTNVTGVNANPPTVRHHGVCVSCHNPHGTSTLQKGGTQLTNMMLIRNWRDLDMGIYCQTCHRLP